MFKKFIERPVLSTVISVILVILGVLGLFKLPLQQFPDIAPPAVLVSAVYPGANAETILRSVAPSLEEAINGVEGMTYMSSTASNDGTLSVTVYFDQGVDPDQAQINVQNRVSTAQSQLPAEVLQQGITTIKQRNGFVSAIGIYSTDPKRYDQAFLTNYAQINIIPEIKRIRGIASVVVFGGVSDYAMRIWLNPGQMAAYHITPGDVQAAIQDKNLEAAPGKFGERSDESFEFVIKYQGKFITPEEYGNIPLRTNPDGSVLRLKNVARLELGAYSYTSTSHANGSLAMGFGIIQLAGSNSNDIQIALDRLMQKASKNFPQGIHYNNFYRTKTSLDESISQVQHTLIEAFVLVFIVVFVFLQDLRSTLIPAIAVPVAILGTFFFLNLFGLSINLLTLFALVLAIGIVVDDAIVVVEAVHSKMEEEHLDAGSATVSAMHEISGAIISITLVMAAVFLPVGFMTGSTGIFYRQFAFTMAIAIVISAVNALTLSPALAALFLKSGHEHNGGPEKQGFVAKFNRGFNRSFQSLTERYTGGLRYLTAHKGVAMAGLILITAFTVYLVRTTRTGFIPTEDQGFIAISVSTPSGTSLSRTAKVIGEAEAKLRALPASRFVFSVSGLNLLTNSSSPSAGVVFVLLNDDKERGPVKDIDAIQESIRGQLSGIPGGSFFVFEFPTVPGFSNVEALDFVLQDKSGGKLDRFSAVSGKFIAKLMQKPAVAYAFTTFRADYPQFKLEVDDDKAGQLGVSKRDILQTMQSYFGSSQASDFNRFGKYYRVILQADIADKADPAAIDKVYVNSNTGASVPIKTLVRLSRVYGSETVSRFNLFNSIQVNAIPKPGFSTGDAIRAVEETAKEELPNGFDYQFQGQTREEISSGGQSAVVFILCLVFVYFLLSAQYESYILPFAVMLSIPAGIFGVFAAIRLTGIENNIYVQVALIMLIGLLAKNAILIVEFALQRRKKGDSLVDAALDGARSRLRPIIMTSLAFITGMIPMMTAKGPSAKGNHSISIGAAGGMLSGVVLGVLIIPVLFVIFQHLQEKAGKRPAAGKDPEMNFENPSMDDLLKPSN
ncbi:efflux RND transporter permease subunit [Mucilaginibacter conchicola]|uniref:Efflux RND transporter permease subunit n=1 Tax=Mucilaginibacter conchicola TaxID=2303333 RepID=A0A372NQE4_9SPHI|nr:efflux RND transporter permease subunit [Mucilaginibacter conchicola]RFZ91142.1 efflux RND transporter permease subunit [Mucilaginibacter conchicola]